MKAKIAVGLGEVKVVRGPEALLVAYGLGSCVGVVVHDPVARVGGLAHVVLPSGPEGEYGARYADRAIPLLLRLLAESGGSPQRAWAKIAGGARMFDTIRLDIGARNVEAVEAAVAAAGLRILARDVGGTRGRTVIYDPEDGRILVRVIGQSEEIL